MALITYCESFDFDLNNKVKQTHYENIEQMKTQGFKELCIYGERLASNSLFTLTPIVLMMLNEKEIVQFEKWFTVATYYPLMISEKNTAFGLINKINPKFYTTFSDGTILISIKSNGKLPITHTASIYKYQYNAPLDVVWHHHLQKVEAFKQKNKQVNHIFSFEDYIALSKVELAHGNKVIQTVKKTWLFIVASPFLCIICLLLTILEEAL